MTMSPSQSSAPPSDLVGTETDPRHASAGQQLKPASSSRIVIPILAILLFGAGVIIFDGRQISQAISQADWQVIPAALFFTAISYLCVGYTYAILARMWGICMHPRDLTEIAFVTTSLNHVVRSGGVAGYSVRYLLMNQHGVKFNEVISSSLVHFYLTSLDMLLMMPVALAYLLFNTTTSTPITVLLSAMTILLIIIAISSTLLVFSDGLRIRCIQLITRTGKIILRRDLTFLFNDFNQHMSYGVRVLRSQAARTSLIMLLTFVDWTASVIVLSLCFDAFGPALKPGVVIVIFMIGIMAGVISALPGGIGIQEGSMTGIAMLFGATFEQAVLAALLFRVIYYFVPYGVSLPFYWHLLRRPAPDYAD